MTCSKVKETFSCTPFNDAPGPATEYISIVHNLHAVKIVHDKMFKELSILTEGKELVSLHVKCLKEINTATNPDGTFDTDKLEKIIHDLKSDLEIKIAKQREELEQKSKTGCPKALHQLERLSKKTQPFLDFLDDTLAMGNEIRREEKMFTKEQLDRLTENINNDLMELNSDNDTQIQQIVRLNNEHHERIQSARLMLKTHHDMFTAIIRNFKNH